MKEHQAQMWDRYAEESRSLSDYAKTDGFSDEQSTAFSSRSRDHIACMRGGDVIDWLEIDLPCSWATAAGIRWTTEGAFLPGSAKRTLVAAMIDHMDPAPFVDDLRKWLARGELSVGHLYAFRYGGDGRRH